MKFNFHYDERGEVASFSEGLNEMPKFKQIELEVSDEEYKKMRLNYKLWICDGKLICEKSQRIIDEEEKEQKEKAKANLKEKLLDPEVQLKDIADLLLELFN